MVPGAVYGPTPCLENGLFHPSYNSRLKRGVEGTLEPQMPRRISPVLVDDCALVCIAALERGKPGHRYLAFGCPEDDVPIAAMCNAACEIARSNHRASEVPVEQLDDPVIVAHYGATVTALARQSYPTPLFNSTQTQAELGCQVTPMIDGLAMTVEWMRKIGAI